MDGIYQEGYEAYLNGAYMEDCPYKVYSKSWGYGCKGLKMQWKIVKNKDMATEKINIDGHEVFYINNTGDIIDEVRLQEQIEVGDRSGTLYWKGYIVSIGRWWITDWKAIAEVLYATAKVVHESIVDEYGSDFKVRDLGKALVEMETNEMEMPTPCQSCGKWFDLNDGYGSVEWYPNTVICEVCGKLKDRELELNEEITSEENSLADAKWQIDESTKELEKLKLKQVELQQQIENQRDGKY